MSGIHDWYCGYDFNSKFKIDIFGRYFYPETENALEPTYEVLTRGVMLVKNFRACQEGITRKFFKKSFEMID